MKILTWNCNGALRKKFHQLIEINADICIIQECENPELTTSEEYKKWASNYLWIGDSKNKGIGIFAKPNIKLEKLEWSDLYENHRVKYFLPCLVNNQFCLLGVWTHQNNSPTFEYIGQFWKYLQVNKFKMMNESMIIVGDLNSNSKWDKWDRWWNHTDVVNQLKEIKIESCYHHYSKEKQGKENQPTFFLYRKRDKTYHIDYVFANTLFIDKLLTVKIGNLDEWLEISDHLPIICEFEINTL